MGRTNPTYRDFLGQFEDRCQPFRRALRREYQPAFDAVFEQANHHADAAGYLNSTDPEFAVLLSVLVAQQRELQTLREEVQN
ncbi:hypothetical protein SG26_14210 [Haloarcula sp. CBA1115]|uniref:hypothetical protein n=1 Tax=unclassified Haloarcula TaxID=2624677 RepID=UPI0005955AD7|nr:MULTISPECIES: hypothetical protein [unclassified Haloarcula]AJF26800.1 hypothetical protein SG26_14210 [Haloarcula sp. CBA1115]